MQGGALALQATLTKQADVGILSYEHVLTVAVQGKRIVAFYCVANRPVNNVIATDKLMAGAEKLSIEEKVKRLNGARVAMPSANGSGDGIATRAPSRRLTFSSMVNFSECSPARRWR